MPDEAEEQTAAQPALSSDAAPIARDLAAQVRVVAASLPFGTDPSGFAAALERLAAEETET